MKRVTLILAGIFAGTCAAAELQATFDTDPEGWGATPGATVTWVEVNSNGYVEATFTNSEPWYFEAPASWLGDWSDYELLKWDLIIASGGYADSNANDIVVIQGANGTNLTWRGPSPYWAWSHYECPLDPAYFATDQATFDGVITNVTALRILGECRGGNEDTGLDNVLLSTNAAPMHTTLSSTFDSDMEGWRPHDDVTLSHVPTNGNPGGYLHGDDWADGRSYRFKTPLSWAGDWSAFNLLSFDMKKEGGTASGDDRELVWIHGGSGETIIHTRDVAFSDWTSHEVYLVPENFDADQATFDRVMGHVTEMSILGEYVVGDEKEGLDNVVVSTEALIPFSTDLISAFDADLEGWTTDGDGAAEWTSSDGNPDGYFLGKDKAQGPVWHFVTPEAWRGNWLNLNWLQFQLKSVAGSLTHRERAMVCLSGMNGIELWWTGPVPHASWTPYGLALTPENFDTDPATFNSVVTFVKHLRIYGEVGSGTDRAGLDTFGLYIERPPVTWPGLSSTFDSDMENWRKYEGVTLGWESTGGNPGGFLRGYNDGSGVWHYVSPESWNGDWTGYRSIRFDHVILQGNDSGWTDPSFYIVGANDQTLGWYGGGSSNAWIRFAANLSPELFGVDQATYDAVMERVVEVRIRGEYVSGSEQEGLDNVYLSTTPIAGPGLPTLAAAGYDGTNVVIQFQTESNVTYRLQASSNLVEGIGWEDVPGESLVGDGGPGALGIDPFDPNLPEQFLRLWAY